MGGSVKAVESGWMQQQIADSAWQKQQAVETGEQVIVGVNKYQSPGDQRPVGIFRPDPETYRIQHERLDHVRATAIPPPFSKRWQPCVPSPQPPPIPPVTSCPPSSTPSAPTPPWAKICGVLREVWGEYQPPVVI